ncbi:MAG: chromosome partitioning protein [Halobacteriovorax sp.]|nr:chromosome partitioning protein [Halobacteriovorax sp.]|tara:strand:- start:334980 stop:335864 length:885 start_codon:yes stop_codon:yes gene_type:complete
MAIIIALANQKGGVGKTTSTINIASCLAIAEKKTLLIDLDPQGNASVGLGIPKELHEEKNIYHVIIGQTELKDAIYDTELPFLKICPSDGNLIGAEIELVSEMAREQKLKNAFATVADDYDYILIDCPPSLGLLTLNALNAANKYIVPLQTEYYAMEGFAQLQNTIRLVRSSLNPDLEMEGVLLTMFDARTSLHKQVSEEMRNAFGDKVFKTVIPRNVKLSECPSFGKPIILYDIESKGSEAYLNVAKEIIMRGRVQAPSEIKEYGFEEIPEIPEELLVVAKENQELDQSQTLN